MTITYHAGRRIQGLDSDKTATQLPAGAVGGWVELGRTTLGSGSTTINVNTLANKRYYMILYNSLGQSGSADPNWTFNADTGSNYADRFSINGGADSTGTSQSNIFAGSQPAGTYDAFSVNYLANYSSKEKLWISHYTAPTIDGATEAPARTETVGKWANTSDPFDEITLTSSATLDTGGEVVVLGYDPADTHTTNFWQELASVELGSANATIDTGTFTAKKYLWFQIYTTGSSVNNLLHIRMNNLSTGIYADRYSHNGGADSTDVSSGSARLSNNNDTLPKFLSGFMINNASNEKLGICHEVSRNTAGAGNAPNRTESVFKIANTSVQATSLQIINLSGTWNSGSKIKVWGAD